MEMKKAWTRPLTTVQQFDANEAISACGDSGTVYKFVCDAGGGRSGAVYLETNGVAGLQQDEDNYLSDYHACGTSHNANSADNFKDGYYVPYVSTGIFSGYYDFSNAQKVIVWRGPQNNNTHCTTNLDMSTWATAKS